jgi:hypothetical protein
MENTPWFGNSLTLLVGCISLLVFQTNRRTTTADRIRKCTNEALKLTNVLGHYEKSRLMSLKKQIDLFNNQYDSISLAVKTSIFSIFILISLIAIFSFKILEYPGILYINEIWAKNIESILSLLWFVFLIISVYYSIVESNQAKETIKEEMDFALKILENRENGFEGLHPILELKEIHEVKKMIKIQEYQIVKTQVENIEMREGIDNSQERIEPHGKKPSQNELERDKSE